ncbi:MAG TPA: hypothetical protein VE685_18165, partial [Thermoanaerobaculia bacterium]|nr:hypothetical protein [Thermoanaerobaculia bacterium]
LASLVLTLPAPAAVEAPGTSAAAVFAEFDRMAGQPLWPGFEPKKIPLAIWDGERTLLVRHPSPPPEFKREGGMWVAPGRHPAMRANTSEEIGGISTATLLLEPGRSRAAREWAAVMIHEAFHVFQRQRHPTWQGNEAELFLYPFDDPGALSLRRLETKALRRALATKDSKSSACWAGEALGLRRERFGKLPASAISYERGTEVNEGLASSVEARALGNTAGPAVPEEFPAEDVRSRAYVTGHALAALLERFDSSWKDTLASGAAASLDELLAAALARATAGRCALPANVYADANEKAKADAARIVQDRRERREAFFARPGWTLEIAAGSQPLFPEGFDPLNVSVLADGEVLHRRFLRLRDGTSAVEVLDRESLTEAAGAHPLFNGVRRLIVTGLTAEPKIRQEGGTVIVEADGVTATLKGAKVEKGEKTVRVVLPST